MGVEKLGAMTIGEMGWEKEIFGRCIRLLISILEKSLG